MKSKKMFLSLVAIILVYLLVIIYIAWKIVNRHLMFLF